MSRLYSQYKNTKDSTCRFKAWRRRESLQLSQYRGLPRISSRSPRSARSRKTLGPKSCADGARILPDGERGGDSDRCAVRAGPDGLVRQGSREAVPFVDYLRATLANGGFAKLDEHEHAAEVRERLAKGRILF